ncbi:MAG: YceI family protein [Flavobacteriales bacterium]|nr:YceI family protein [Flavobacteriales bacterium]
MLRNTFMLLAMVPLLTAAQKYGTRNGQLQFRSETPLETIEAENFKGTCVLDASTGAIEFMALIKGFQFEKALMQEHFNENYMESDKFPKASFKGTVDGMSAELITRPGRHDLTVNGELTIHGVTKPLSTPVTVEVQPTGATVAECGFIILPEDHDIAIPGMVRDNIAKEIHVKVKAELQKL